MYCDIEPLLASLEAKTVPPTIGFIVVVGSESNNEKISHIYTSDQQRTEDMQDYEKYGKLLIWQRR